MAEHLIEIGEAETDLLACAAYIAESIKSADGHAAAMSEIVPRYLERNAVDLAAELANAVDDPFRRDRLLMRVAEKCAEIGDDEYAFQLVEAIEETAAKDEARELIAMEKAAQGDFAKALEIVGDLPHADYALTEIAARQADCGDASALETVEKIDSADAKATALRILASIYLEKDDAGKAVSLLDRAALLAGEIDFQEEKIRALVGAGERFLEAKENGKAIESFDRAKNAVETLEGIQKDSFLENIAHGFLQAGSVELADRTLDLIGDNVRIASTLAGFAREFWKRGEKAEAVESLEEAYSIFKSQRSVDVRNSKERFELWTKIAVEFARFEKPERAIEIAQEIPEENSQTSALAQIAQICAAQNEDASRQALNVLHDDSQKTFALLGVSDANNRAGKNAEAMTFLNEAAVFAGTVDRLAARSAAFDELAQRFHAHGDAEKMREMNLENLDTIINIRDESDRTAALAKMADFYEAEKLELNEAEREMMLRIIAKSSG